MLIMSWLFSNRWTVVFVVTVEILTGWLNIASANPQAVIFLVMGISPRHHPISPVLRIAATSNQHDSRHLLLRRSDMMSCRRVYGSGKQWSAFSWQFLQKERLVSASAIFQFQTCSYSGLQFCSGWVLSHTLPHNKDFIIKWNHLSIYSLLAVPRVRTCFGSRSFAVAAPTIWNSLPLHIRNSSSVFGFRRQLKTFLYKYSLQSFLATHPSASNSVVFLRHCALYKLLTYLLHVTSLSIFCCRLKSHLFSLSYPAFWLFSHLYSARAVTRHFGHYNRYYI